MRGFIAVLLSLSLSGLVFLHQVSLPTWLVASALLGAFWFVFGGDDIIKGEGRVKLLGKDLLVEDLILYGALGVYANCLINGAFSM